MKTNHYSYCTINIIPYILISVRFPSSSLRPNKSGILMMVVLSNKFDLRIIANIIYTCIEENILSFVMIKIFIGSWMY